MSIPLDRLYHYIENIAEEISNDSIIIYRFYPHGSKILEDLLPLSPHSWAQLLTSPHLICNDQEPLNYDWYQDMPKPMDSIRLILKKYAIELPDINLRKFINIYDHCILLHSEQRSENLEKYKNNNFIPVYYWSHAVIALDWFRFAQYVPQKKTAQQTFLIYNRAWSGTREYRLGFADRLIWNDIVKDCLMRVSPVDSTIDKHYDLHNFTHPEWRPLNVIEQYFPLCEAESHYSADFDQKDYESTEIEIVLETLFDDTRLHLTEKTLRPIAMGQPFMLAGTYGSLKYLRDYGFKTFSDCWDESYDMMSDSQERMNKIIDVMKHITSMLPTQREEMLTKARAIADYNRQHFFSEEFFDQITSELKDNLATAINQIHYLNTGKRYIDLRKQYSTNAELKQHIIQADSVKSKQDIIKVLSKARQYYMGSLKHNT